MKVAANAQVTDAGCDTDTKKGNSKSNRSTLLAAISDDEEIPRNADGSTAIQTRYLETECSSRLPSEVSDKRIM